jgi:hypothetical protein
MDYYKYTNNPLVLEPSFYIRLHIQRSAFEEIIGNYSSEVCKEASRQERENNSLTRSSLTYGEVDFTSLAEVLEIISQTYGPIPKTGTFYDLGSGSGKGVISAALLHSFHKCVGVELLQGLWDISQEIKLSYEQLRLSLIEKNGEIWSELPDVEFVNADLFSVDWSDAGFIFVNSTCFEQQMMDKIAEREVKTGTWAVTLTKPMENRTWRIMQSFRKMMSWGYATVYIHQKIPNDHIFNS